MKSTHKTARWQKVKYDFWCSPFVTYYGKKHMLSDFEYVENACSSRCELGELRSPDKTLNIAVSPSGNQAQL